LMDARRPSITSIHHDQVVSGPQQQRSDVECPSQ
jgi:hypothetical protein